MDEEQTSQSILSLADWRRRVAELYAEVRRVAATDPERAHAFWRASREALYREHACSPVPEERRAVFAAAHFPYDPALRFELAVEPAPPPDVPSLVLPASSGTAPSFDRIGWIDVPFADGSRRLALFWIREYSGGLFLPFRDRTNDGETYGAGRYVLDSAKAADLGPGSGPETIVVDFNFAYQPSCAFDPRWSCPLAPRENWLDLPIRAGERLS